MIDRSPAPKPFTSRSETFARAFQNCIAATPCPMKPFSINSTVAAAAALLALPLLALQHVGAEAAPTAVMDAFFAIPVDPGAVLSADKFYPQGRRMVFAGYSGQPARDLADGFTVGGPFYGAGNEKESLEAIAAERPCLVQIGASGANHLQGIEAAANLSDDEIRRMISDQVLRYVKAEDAAKSRSVVWWCVEPEELRPWKKEEMHYLDVVADTIRKTDPHQRPVFLYNPNHRDAASLAPIAKHVDVLAKGCYVNSAGYKNERGWIRDSIEQMLKAEKIAEKIAEKSGVVVVMPELCKDPEPGERQHIAAWARHDTYLGLMSGAKGVLIWSLFPRKEVKATWQTWYAAYAQAGRELNGVNGLAPVFLFGERRDDIAVSPQESRPARPARRAENGLEQNTTRSDEGANALAYPWTKTELAYGPNRYLLIANSYPEKTEFRITGIPRGARMVSAFDGTPIDLTITEHGTLLTLEPWEIAGLKLSAR